MSTSASATVHLTTQNFEQEAIASDKPVLVDFHAAWCPPCKALGPTIDALADDYAGRAVVAKVDVDANGALAERYGVQSIPTILLLKQGEVVERRVGLAQKGELAALLDSHLG